MDTLWSFLEQNYFFVLIGNGIIWLALRHLGIKIYEEDLCIGKWFFVRRIIYVLHYINWGIAILVLVLFGTD